MVKLCNPEALAALIVSFGLLLGWELSSMFGPAEAAELHKARCPFVGGGGALGFVDEHGEFYALVPNNMDSADTFVLWENFNRLGIPKWGEPRMILDCFPPRKPGEKTAEWQSRGVPIVVPKTAKKCIVADAETDKTTVYCD